MFIDLHRSAILTDLVSSYNEILNARRTLLGKWRFPLLRAYAKRHAVYGLRLSAQRASKELLWRFRWAAGLGLAALVVWGCITAYSVDICGGSLILSATLAGGLIAWSVWKITARAPKPPEHPLSQRWIDGYTSPLKQTLFPETLLPKWHRELSDPVPSEEEAQGMAEDEKKYGLIGEYNLVRALTGVVSTNTVILHSVMPKPKDDLDVVLIGPKGIWYFEVKYLNAHIECQDGKWTIGKLDPRTGEIKFEQMNEDPDQQWCRMRDEILRNLRNNGSKYLSALPDVGKIKGGIVFAHPDATFNIQKPPPLAWGRTQAWINAYQKAPKVPGMSPVVMLGLTEIFLKRHRELNPAQQVFSMRAARDQILQSVEGDIQKWIAAS